ncbi:MAG: hypothetical protein V4607_01860 [Pseudomonadota bacterium]
MTAILLFWWRIRYAIAAMYVMHCTPRLAWHMATADDTAFNDGDTPIDALYEELSYWTADE